MTIEIDGLTINYIDEGEGSPVLLLHGWGCRGSHWNVVTNKLKEKYRVIAPDLPGFGDSTEPPPSWGTPEYSSLMEKFINSLELGKPHVVGHSNGGRIAIDLASRGLCSKLILVDSAGIPPHRSASYYAKVYSYKAFKKVLSLPGLSSKKEEILDKKRKKSGSDDYNAASPIMRQIMSRVLNEDLRPELGKIKNPTLLVWGSEDTATPLSDGKKMEAILTPNCDCALIVFEGASHFAFLDDRSKFNGVVMAFLG